MNAQLPIESETAVKIRVRPKQPSRFEDAFRYFGQFVRCLFLWGGDRGIKYAEARVQRETNEANRIGNLSIKEFEESQKIKSEKRLNEAATDKIHEETNKMKHENFSMFLNNLERVKLLPGLEKELAYQVLLETLPEGRIRQKGESLIAKIEHLRLKDCEIFPVPESK